MTCYGEKSHRVTVLIGAALAVAAVTAWPTAWASGIEPKTGPTAVHAVPEITAFNKTRYRAWIPKQDAEAILVEVSSGEVSPAVMENRAKSVKAGGFLELNARVREMNGRPVSGVPVLFEWKTKGRSQRFAKSTDEQGVAAVRRWVRESERGRPAIVFVTVETPKWSASRYAWYVAE